MSSSSSEYQLNRKEVDFFVANGYLGPYAAMSPEAMALIRREIEEKVLSADGPNPRSRVQSRHPSGHHQPHRRPAWTGSRRLGDQLLAEAAGRRRNPLASRYQLLATGTAGEHLRLDRHRPSHRRKFLRTDHSRLTSQVASSYTSAGRNGFRRNGRSGFIRC